MSESLGLTPEASAKKLKELSERKRRIEASLAATGINPDYVGPLAAATADHFNRLRAQLNSVSAEISEVVEWFNLYLLEHLQTSTQTLVTLTKGLESHSRKVNRLTWGLIGLTAVLVATTIADIILRVYRF